MIDSTAYGADPIQPPDTTLVNGLFKITLQGCTPGEAELKVRLVYPEELPEGSRYWKYGKTAENPTDHWYVLPNAVIEGNTISFTIKDGGLGDDDLTANGSIIDPGGAADPWELDAIETGGPVDITLPTNVPRGDDCHLWGERWILVATGLVSQLFHWSAAFDRHADHDRHLYLQHRLYR